MRCLKICIFYTFLTLIKIGAEVIRKDDSYEMSALSVTTLPIALQVAEHEILQPPMAKSNKHTNYQGNANEVEVFKDKLGPQMEKQDEAPEEEAQPEAEEEKPEEEAEAEAEEPAEPEAEPTEEETKPDELMEEEQEAPTAPEAEQETVKDPEPEPEPEPQLELQPEPETQPQPEETANTDEAAAANDESEMPNDEPAKEEEQDKKDAVNVAEDETTKTIAAKDHNQPEVSCFTCTSAEDLKCHMKATHQVPCPKVNEGDAGKHNGCYTLYQADTNTTMRGCVDELAEEGLKYCLTNEKLCNVCYKNGCNNKVAPNHGNMLQFNLYAMLFLNVFSIITIKKLKNVSLI